MQTIGATTLDEYRKHLAKDAALERRFQQILVKEPSVLETRKILAGLRERYEAHHRVRITDEALEAAAYLADRYISDRFLPDKAVDLVDEAASRKRIQNMCASPDLREVEDAILEVRREKEAAIEVQDFEKAASLRDRERKLLARRRELEDKWQESEQGVEISIGEEEIAEVTAMWTGIPVAKLTEAETHRLLRMEESLHKRVVGQDEAVRSVSRAIRRSRAGLKDPHRPAGSFIFLGPSAWARPIGADARRVPLREESALIQVDMSEYMESTRQPFGGLSSRIRRLRRGRAAHGVRTPPAVFGGPARRDREGASRCVQHPVADPGRWTPHRRTG